MNDLGEERKGLESIANKSCSCDDCSENKEKEEVKKHYPRESFTTDQMPALSKVSLGDKVMVTLEAEVCAIKAGSEYEYDENEENETRVTLKLLTGAVKTMDKEEKSEDSETTTLEDKKNQAVDKFNDYIDVDDEKGK